MCENFNELFKVKLLLRSNINNTMYIYTNIEFTQQIKLFYKLGIIPYWKFKVESHKIIIIIIL